MDEYQINELMTILHRLTLAVEEIARRMPLPQFVPSFMDKKKV